MIVRRNPFFPILRMIALIVAGLVVALVVALSQVNLDTLRSSIVAVLQDATGMPVQVDGDVSWKLSLRPKIELNNVRVANADWAKNKYAYSADKIDVRLNLISLFRDRPTIQNVKLYDVKVNIEKNENGQYSVPNLKNTNPDGAELVLDGLNSVPCNITKQYLTIANNGSENFSQYKANINLIDLNTNFDANWGGGSQNITCPSTEDFIGFYPNSEREVNSLIDFTLKNKPLLTISYHTKGNVIFYGFEGQSESDRTRDFKIGSRFSELTGYPLILTENSTGGYKDWCIQKLKIPAYTFEVGDETLPHPLGIETLPEIYNRNKDVPLLALDLAKEYAKNIDNTTPNVQNITNGENHNVQTTQTNGRSYLARLQGWFNGRNSNRSSNS